MFSERVLWAALTASLVASWYLILTALFHDSGLGVVVFGTFLVGGFSVALMPSSRTKRPYKVMFLAASVVSAGFAIGLDSGLFESAILLPDSYIDVSRSLAVFHLQNNGLTDFSINKFELGNVSFTFRDPTSGGNTWARGESRYFIIYYVENTLGFFRTLESWYLSPFEGAFHLSIVGEVTPSTFIGGISYPLVLTTNGLLRHKFDVEARRTMDEELRIQASVSRDEHRIEFRMRFNNTGSYCVHLFSIEIANVVFYLTPPAIVVPEDWSGGSYQVLNVDFYGEPGFRWGSSMFMDKIYAIPEPRLSMLNIGETYQVRIRTMTDNMYVTNVTI